MSSYDQLLDFLRSERECPLPQEEPPDGPPRLTAPAGGVPWVEPPELLPGDETELGFPMDDPLLDLDGPVSNEFQVPLFEPEDLQAWRERDQWVKEWLNEKFDNYSPTRGRMAARQPIEAAGWYQPISFYGSRAGIFIRSSGIRNLAALIHEDAWGISATSSLAVAEILIREHERFHHFLEAQAIREHVQTGVPRYRRYSRSVFTPAQQPFLTDNLLEEALATAYSVRRLRGAGSSERERLICELGADAFERTLGDRPPGYRLAGQYVADEGFRPGLIRLARSVSSGRLEEPPRDGTPQWQIPLTAVIGGRWLASRTRIVGDDRPPFGVFFAIDDRRLQRYLRKQGFMPTDLGTGSHTVWKDEEGRIVNLPDRKDQSGYKVLNNVARSLGMSIRELKDEVNRR